MFGLLLIFFDIDGRDDNWDGNKSNRFKLGERPSYLVTRHIMLIRHGQYEEGPTNDDHRVLTDLGMKQARKTGERLAEIIRSASDANSKGCPLKLLCSSSLTRAKQTADIIYEEIQAMTSKYNEQNPDKQPWDRVERGESDPMLIEGFPVHHIPGPTGFTGLHVEDIDRDFPRVEEAFNKYVGRSDWLEENESPPHKELSPKNKEGPTVDHEYEIIVGTYNNCCPRFDCGLH
jgi:serine/threonine-protein phosphatase PGAM5